MENKNNSIKNWAEDDRPREKLEKHGASVLSNAELLAIIINTGNKEKSAVELAKDILAIGQNNLDELGKLSLKELQSVKGIGIAKAITIAAVLEIGRRRTSSISLERTKLKSAKEYAAYLRDELKDYPQEVFAVLYLNNAMRIKTFKIISSGGITSTIADPRIILKYALEEAATNIIICHNHPSGNVHPSQADISITEKIKIAASYLDIRLVDHIIVSSDGHFSFADNSMI
jgi:DNA repair protein RadC